MTGKRYNVWDIDGTIFLEDHKEGSYHIGQVENVDINCLNDIANRLNDLNDENEQLRHDATILIQSNQDYRRENEQLKQIIYEDESQIIGEWSSHIQEDMKELNKAYESEDINDLIRFCKEG